MKILVSPLKSGTKNWLSSSQVAHGMKLINDKFPSFNILYNSPFFPYNQFDFSFKHLLRKESGESVIKENTFFVINVSSHWILLTNCGCDTNSWHVYDSLFNSSYLFSLDTMFKAFNQLYQENDVFFVTHRDVIRQSGANDCGLFVLGFIFAICEGKNPTFIQFKQKEMRSHYIECIENRNFNQFPHNELFNKTRINDNNYVYDCKSNKFVSNKNKYV